MTERHIIEGEEHVTGQREIVRRLFEQGHAIDMAQALLAEFEATLRNHIAHRERILAARSPH
jgi:hypothetical protein